MSYEFMVSKQQKARKEHQCIWCPEKIAIGEIYVREFGFCDGSVQCNCWHPECRYAFSEYSHQTGENEIYPHESKRGGTEHA